MSITDELRKYTEEQIKWLDMTKVHYRKLFAIADRIDAEHERMLAAATLVAGIPMTDENMAEHGWFRLPKDADGVPIHFGDKVTVPWSDKVYEVAGFSYTQQLAGGNRTIWVDVYSHEKPGNVPLCGVDGCHHYYEPTVEDVLCELLDEYREGECTMAEDRLADYAKRLRLAEGEGE